MALLDLFVGDHDERDGLVVPPTHVSESTQGIKTGQQAGFHVTGARTNQLAANRGDRALRGRSARVNGVGMAKQQNPRAALPLSTSDQIVTPAGLRPPLDREAELPQ